MDGEKNLLCLDWTRNSIVAANSTDKRCCNRLSSAIIDTPFPLKQQKWRCDIMKNLGRIPTPFGQDFSSKVITPEQGCIS